MLLNVQDLIIRFYGAEGAVHALNGVSFALEAGETLAVVGESGSGKSVTMMSLLGLIPQPPGKVESGRALFTPAAGPTTDLLTLREQQLHHVRGGQIGFIFQDPLSSLNPVMPIGRQIAETMVLHLHLGQAEAERRTIQLLERVGFSDAAARYHSYPHQFSGGMRQRVMIAIAIACDPQLVIADEPTTALDVTVQAQIIELVKAIQAEKGMAIIWISHDLGVVAGLADRVLVLYGGTVVESAAVDDLYDNPQHPYTIGLLGAMPSVETRREKLVSIEGTPPDLLSELTYCPFAERCAHVMARCRQERPPLVEVQAGHHSACFYDVAQGKPRDA